MGGVKELSQETEPVTKRQDQQKYIALKKARRKGDVAFRLHDRARDRAKAKNLPFTIKVADIYVPEKCPLLGVPLTNDGRGPNAPSLDRIDSQKGYTPDNVWVISYRANSMKNTLSLKEAETMLANLLERRAARLAEK